MRTCSEKRPLYQKLGVREYFLFDPESAYLQPSLQGFRLNAQGLYVPLKLDERKCLHCEELGLLLKHEERFLRLIDVKTGVPSFVSGRTSQTLKPSMPKPRRRRPRPRKRRSRPRKRRPKPRKRRPRPHGYRKPRRNEHGPRRKKQRADALQLELERLKSTIKENGGKMAVADPRRPPILVRSESLIAVSLYLLSADASHTRIVWSQLPEASLRPIGPMAMLVTPPPWPRSVSISSPVSVSQTLTV